MWQSSCSQLIFLLFEKVFPFENHFSKITTLTLCTLCPHGGVTWIKAVFLCGHYAYFPYKKDLPWEDVKL